MNTYDPADSIVYVHLPRQTDPSAGSRTATRGSAGGRSRVQRQRHGLSGSARGEDDGGGRFHQAGREARVSGPDPDRTSYATFASFADPDGNEWALQEITSRLPGR